MLKQREYIIEAAGSIFDESYHTNSSLAIDLDLKQVDGVIRSLLLFSEKLIDTLIIKDTYTKDKVIIERHERFHTSMRKGKLRARSTIAKCDDKTWRLLITKNDLDTIISWYLRGFIDVVYRHGVLDIECEESNMLMFSTQKTIDK